MEDDGLYVSQTFRIDISFQLWKILVYFSKFENPSPLFAENYPFGENTEVFSLDFVNFHPR